MEVGTMPRTASGEPKSKLVHRPQKNGDIYVYEVTTLYNPKKKYNEHVSSKLLGKIPKGSDEMVPTRPKRSGKQSPIEATQKTVGVTDILDWIGRESGIDDDLFRSTDQGTAQKIISIARFWMANPDKTIRRIEEWQINHMIPYENGMSEDTCYELMKALGRDTTTSQNYFFQRAAHAPSKASVAVDSTTISSYSECLNDVRYGYNKDGNGLASVKLLTLYSLENHQPIAFTRQPGNIPDVISVMNSLKQLSVLGMEKPLLVLDGGFFSESNILLFIRDHTKFLMRGQLDGKWIAPELQKVISTLEKPSNSCPDAPGTYGVTVRINHTFHSERKRSRGDIRKGELVTEDHRLYLHFFRDTAKARIDTEILMDNIQKVRGQLLNGVDIALLSKAEKRIADQFLAIKVRKSGTSVTLDDDAILEEVKYYGCFVLVSNQLMDAFTALREYRLREKTEEGFRLDKQNNDAHTTRAKTTSSLEGRFFCQFVAYGYEAFFQNAIRELKSRLAVPTGDPAHDKSEQFKKEKSLLNWLNGMSVAKLFDWFDAIQETTVNTNMGRIRWRTETIARDRLFLTLLGMLKS